MYLQPQINEALESLRDRIVDRPHTFDGVAALINRQFGIYFGTDVRVYADERSDLQPYESIISGIYNCMRSRFPIEIIYHHGPAPDNIIFTDEEFDILKFRVSQALQHEYIHKLQNEKRPEDVEPRVYHSNKTGIAKTGEEYLASPDELDAHAHDIALEISRNQCYDDLRTPGKIMGEQSATLAVYQAVFQDNPSVMKRLFKKAWQYLQYEVCRWPR